MDAPLAVQYVVSGAITDSFTNISIITRMDDDEADISFTRGIRRMKKMHIEAMTLEMIKAHYRKRAGRDLTQEIVKQELARRVFELPEGISHNVRSLILDVPPATYFRHLKRHRKRVKTIDSA